MNVEEKLYKLTEIGIALSRERNIHTILGTILSEARLFTQAEAGSLYVKQENELIFAVSQNDHLSSYTGDFFRGKRIPIDNKSIAGYAAVTGKVINLEDAYAIPAQTPYKLNRSFDMENNYRTKSMLVIPMKESDENIVGVLALINAKDKDNNVIPFEEEYQFLISSLASQAAVCITNAKLNEQLKEAYLDTIFCLSRAAEFRDKETAFHIERISKYAVILAKELRFEEAYIERIRYASPMHDIGKIGISDSILLKPGKLTSEEYTEMKKHTSYGADILSRSNSDILKMSLEIAITHHEKYDGSGYPNGLKGEEIPWSGRIVAVADVFDALTCKRCYKKAWATNDAIEYIKSLSGKHFDPKVVAAFEAAIPEILEAKEQYTEKK